MKIMIFKNDKGFYSKGVSKKMQDGTYQKAYFPVQFKKGVELANRTQIEVKNSFLSFYMNKENKPVFYEMIIDFELANGTTTVDTTAINTGNDFNSSELLF